VPVPSDFPVHGLDVDPVVLVLVAVVCIPLAEGARAVTAVLLGDPTPRVAGRLWRVDRNLHLFGGVIVPALLALTGGVVVGWPGQVPVRDGELTRPRRAAVALAGPVAHVALAGVGVLLSGEVGEAVVQVNLLTALFLLVPVPPFPGGALLAALVPALDERGGRWDRWRRTDTTPWALTLLAAVVAWHTVTR
jgi:Zn-dependent protease